MRKSRIFTILLCLSVFLHPEEAQGQFRFGVFGGPSLSQVDGDNLRGFRYLGVSTGLLGGYKLDNGNSIVVDLGYNSLGSKKGSESVPDEANKILLKTNFQTINILLGYQFLFGDRWDGKKYYMLRGGLNFHRIFKKGNGIFSNSFGITEDEVSKEEINSQYFALNFSVGKILSDKVVIRLGVDYGLDNLLKTPQYNISSISPYQIFFNTSYYVF